MCTGIKFSPLLVFSITSAPNVLRTLLQPFLPLQWIPRLCASTRSQPLMGPWKSQLPTAVKKKYLRNASGRCTATISHKSMKHLSIASKTETIMVCTMRSSSFCPIPQASGEKLLLQLQELWTIHLHQNQLKFSHPAPVPILPFQKHKQGRGCWCEISFCCVLEHQTSAERLLIPGASSRKTRVISLRSPQGHQLLKMWARAA